MIQPGIFSRFSQPAHFTRFKPDNLLLFTAKFSGYNLEKYVYRTYRLTKPGKTARFEDFTGIFTTSVFFRGIVVKDWSNLPTDSGRGQKSQKFANVLNGWSLTRLLDP